MARRSSPVGAGELDGRARLSHQGATRGKHGGARLGQGDAPGGAVEQAHPEVLLEGGNLVLDRRVARLGFELVFLGGDCGFNPLRLDLADLALERGVGPALGGRQLLEISQGGIEIVLLRIEFTELALDDRVVRVVVDIDDWCERPVEAEFPAPGLDATGERIKLLAIQVIGS